MPELYEMRRDVDSKIDLMLAPAQLFDHLDNWFKEQGEYVFRNYSHGVGLLLPGIGWYDAFKAERTKKAFVVTALMTDSPIRLTMGTKRKQGQLPTEMFFEAGNRYSDDQEWEYFVVADAADPSTMDSLNVLCQYFLEEMKGCRSYEKI